MDSFTWASVSQTAGTAAGSAVSDSRGGVLLSPPMLGFQLPTQAGLQRFIDSGHVQRAARSSCLGAGNIFSEGLTAGAKITSERPPGLRSNAAAAGSGDGSDAEQKLGGGGDHNNAAAAARDGSSGGPTEPGSKKRRRSDEDIIGTDQAKKASDVYSDPANESAPGKGATGEQNGGTASAAAATTGKKRGKGAKEDDEPYVHIRARRGQATNNHSLAERLRREKISERMKLLQDLVPSCSKVTGKAVMLDEIINYVQSLQRQVEFLSMKLATVNPQLGLNVEGLLSKEQPVLFLGAPSSAPIGFSFSQSQEMMPRLSQSVILQGGFDGVANSDEKGSFREHFYQIPATSNTAVHDAAQMVYRAAVDPEHLSMMSDQDPFHM